MRAVLRAGAVTTLTVALAGCGLFGGDERRFPAANPARVALTMQTREAVHVGLIVSPNAPKGEGREWASLAAGARVAQVRYAEGGANVVLDIEDDTGTAAGGRAAVQALVDKGVVGIVYASSGAHLADGLSAAAAADVPVLLPYAESLPDGASTAWLTGPSARQVAATLRARLDAERLGTPALITVGSAPAEVVSTFGGGPVTAVRSSAAVVRRHVPDDARAAVVWGSGAELAHVVERLRAAQIAAPLLLRPTAMSAEFVDTLAAAVKRGSASLSGRYITAGIPTVDVSPGFTAAVRLAASSPATLSVTGGAAFAERGAKTADTRAHDAVLALAVAADRSRTRTAATVLTTLRGLSLTRRDGLAGAPLAFGTPQALSDEHVVALQSSAAPGGDSLQWFALPDEGAS